MRHTPNHARIEDERQRFQRALDEYLNALESAPSSVLREKKRVLLGAYAEFRYQVQGGTHCVLCRTHVRHAMTVEVRRGDGTVSQFESLCTRCLEGQKAEAESVMLRVGPVEYETMRRVQDDTAAPGPRSGRTAAA